MTSPLAADKPIKLNGFDLSVLIGYAVAINGKPHWPNYAFAHDTDSKIVTSINLCAVLKNCLKEPKENGAAISPELFNYNYLDSCSHRTQTKPFSTKLLKRLGHTQIVLDETTTPYFDKDNPLAKNYHRQGEKYKKSLSLKIFKDNHRIEEAARHKWIKNLPARIEHSRLCMQTSYVCDFAHDNKFGMFQKKRTMVFGVTAYDGFEAFIAQNTQQLQP